MTRANGLLLALSGAAALASLAVAAATEASVGRPALSAAPGIERVATTTRQAPLAAADREVPRSAVASRVAQRAAELASDAAACEAREADARRVAELVTLLEDGSEAGTLDRRVRAVELAGRIEALDGALAPVLRARLAALATSVEPSLRELIGIALGELRPDPTLRLAMLDLFESPASSAETRAAALAALSGLGDEATVPALAGMLDVEGADSARIARTIAAIGGVEAAGVLLAHLSRAELAPSEARALERRIAGQADPRVIDRVAVELASPDPRARCSALRVLGLARSVERVEEVRSLLALERDPAVRAAAVEALGTIGGETAVRALVELGRAPEPALARRASLALGSLRDATDLDGLAAEWPGLDASQRLAALAAASRCDELGEPMRRAAERALASADAREQALAARALERDR